MLQDDRVGLRARHQADVPVLHAELYDDVATRSRADSRPWRPLGAMGPQSPYAIAEPTDDTAPFSVVTLPDHELAGEALLWGIDLHNRLAHVGISLLPSHRGRGLSVDVVRLLCRYGFAIRGLHRLQLETLADNSDMIRVADRAGFEREGLLRAAAWLEGRWVDELVFGLLAEDWHRSSTMS
jgi:RimJ/RimL family protein N-acetyltransferase